MNELKTLEKCKQYLEGLLLTDKEYMSADDVNNLKGTIDGLQKLEGEYKRKAYIKQLLQFKTYLEESISCFGSKGFEAYTEQQFTITHGDRTVTIENSATVHELLVGLLQVELDDFAQ